jgi:hypothetical protein
MLPAPTVWDWLALEARSSIASRSPRAGSDGQSSSCLDPGVVLRLLIVTNLCGCFVD